MQQNLQKYYLRSQDKKYKNQKGNEISERKITNIDIINKSGREEIYRSLSTSNDSEWTPSVTNKNTITNSKKSEINQTQRKINEVNIIIYDTNIQQYLANRKRSIIVLE